MKKLLKFLLYTALAIVALVVILGLFAKKDYHIERSLENVGHGNATAFAFVNWFSAEAGPVGLGRGLDRRCSQRRDIGR